MRKTFQRSSGGTEDHYSVHDLPEIVKMHKTSKGVQDRPSGGTEDLLEVVGRHGRALEGLRRKTSRRCSKCGRLSRGLRDAAEILRAPFPETPLSVEESFRNRNSRSRKLSRAMTLPALPARKETRPPAAAPPPPPPSPPPPLRLFDLVTAPLADFLQQKCRQRCRDSGGVLKVVCLHPLGRNHPEHEQ